MLQLFARSKTRPPASGEAPGGRADAIETAATHHVSGRALKGPYPAGTERVLFGMGCFWGTERLFWRQPGVWVTAVGYAAGETPNPTYREVCSGRTGHNEVVLVIYQPATLPFDALLSLFWEGHDPTQGMRQGNDVGTQYRSGLYTTTPDQKAAGLASRTRYADALRAAGRPAAITTEILDASAFYFAEDYHQQYLAKNPNGYCGLGGCGVSLPAA